MNHAIICNNNAINFGSIDKKIKAFQFDMAETYGIDIEVFVKPNDNYNINNIIDIICEVCGVSEEQIMSRDRYMNIVIARQLIIYVCVVELKVIKRLHIGKRLRRDHTTVFHSINTVTDKLGIKEEPYYSTYNKIMTIINSNKGGTK